MTLFIILAIVTLGSSVTFAAMDEKDYGGALQAIYKIWHDKCQLITGITREEINRMKNGTFAETEREQRYILCLYLISNVLSNGLEFDTALIEYYMPAKASKGVQNYLDCLEETKKSGVKEAYQKTWVLTRCMFQKDPEHFLMF